MSQGLPKTMLDEKFPEIYNHPLYKQAEQDFIESAGGIENAVAKDEPLIAHLGRMGGAARALGMANILFEEVYKVNSEFVANAVKPGQDGILRYAPFVTLKCIAYHLEKSLDELQNRLNSYEDAVSSTEEKKALDA